MLSTSSSAQTRRPSLSSLWWYPLVAAISLLPVLGVFTTTRIFFVRDLSFFFWSRHLWLRHTLFAGQAPWWDPYVAAGQSAIADALNQLLMPVTLAIRLLPSDVVSFNLWVALPLPVAALGTFAFLRRRALRPASARASAALGACIFALSGPIVSTLNMPNLSWSIALMPWVLAAVEGLRPQTSALGPRTSNLGPRFAVLAMAFALQALCGEPVTWVATGAIAAAYSLVRRPWMLREQAATLGALAAGALLAAAQVVPTLVAGLRAHRAAVATPDFWSLHPVALWEAIAPNLFGNYYDAFLADLPWMTALNFGRDPFFYSLYVGPLVLLLALAGAVGASRRNALWVMVAGIAVTAALGGYTPLYPLARKLVPPLMYFRFPVKYIVFAAFACAVLAADGWAVISEPAPGGAHDRQPDRIRAARTRWTGWVAGITGAGLLASLVLAVMPHTAAAAAHWLALSTHLKDPAAGASFLARSASPLAARFFGLALAGGMLAAVAHRRSVALPLLFGAVCMDLAITNGSLNLTIDAAKLAPPEWYTASAGPQRLYVGGRVRGFMNTRDPDAAQTWRIPAERTAIEGRMELNADLPMAPSGWRVREALSYDLPYLWPADYEALVRRFERARPDERAAFLRRSGVRRCVLPQTERRQFRAIADVPNWEMRVFECNAGAVRAFLAAAADVTVKPGDPAWEREALFDPALPDSTVRLSAAPATAGRAGPPEPPSVRIVEDGTTRVVLDATLNTASVLVLRDTYDPSWTAEADGAAAAVARANGAYRAIALPPGRHVIRFSYRPRDFAAGLILSAMTAILLTLASMTRRNRPVVRDDRGFTLIELMIVLAILGILLAVAFAEYRGMQARGNDASAVASMRSIATAQWQFALTCGNMKYASTLPALAQPVPATGQGFLSPDLTSAETFEKSGYTFHLAAKPIDQAPPACNGAAVAEGYAATADPVKPGTTGGYFYGVNADRVLYVDEQKTYTDNLPETGPASHGSEVR